jgi:general secretion pathway protein G
MKQRRTARWKVWILGGLLFVMVILGAVIHRMNSAVDEVNTGRSRGDLKSIRTSLLAYATSNGFYPTTEQGLRALVVRPESDPVPKSWKRLFEDVPKDVWGSEFVYRCPGWMYPNGYDLFCAGPDRTRDTADDIWED